jgi:hypothetical protein
MMSVFRALLMLSERMLQDTPPSTPPQPLLLLCTPACTAGPCCLDTLVLHVIDVTYGSDIRSNVLDGCKGLLHPCQRCLLLVIYA